MMGDLSRKSDEHYIDSERALSALEFITALGDTFREPEEQVLHPVHRAMLEAERQSQIDRNHKRIEELIMAAKRYKVVVSVDVQRTDADAQTPLFWETSQTWHNMKPQGVTGLQRMLVGMGDQLVTAGEENAAAAQAKEAAAG